MDEFPTFGARDLGSGHTAYRHASLVDLYLHTKFHWNRSLCERTDEWTFETGFIRSTRRSPPKNAQNAKPEQTKQNLNLNQHANLRTVNMCVCVCVHIIVHNCHTQYSTEQFW